MAQWNREVVNLEHYGVPQSRKRFTLIASRLNRDIKLPPASEIRPTVRDAIGDYDKFPPIPEGQRDTTNFRHSTAGLSAVNIERLKMTPVDGGSRSAWVKTDLQLETYKRNNVGFGDTYGRMTWDKPASTITTKFFSISCGRFGHPEQLRAISIREGATLQTFPIEYKFLGTSMAAVAKLIGNAVPPEYARRLGVAIKQHHEVARS